MPLSQVASLDVTDDELVQMFRDGDLEALNLLLERYRRFARSKARGYFLVGADFDDIEQEGMIGLFKAVRDFRADRQSSFRAFAELCITRQILTAIKTATRQKHQPLNRYVSLSGLRVVDDPSEWSVEELLDDHHVWTTRAGGGSGKPPNGFAAIGSAPATAEMQFGSFRFDEDQDKAAWKKAADALLPEYEASDPFSAKLVKLQRDFMAKVG